MGLKDGSLTEAWFDHPPGMALDAGRLDVADTHNSKIDRIDPKTHTASS